MGLFKKEKKPVEKPNKIKIELALAKGKHLYGLPKGKHVFGTAKVGEKGQIVIPKEARELFGIKAGDTLLILGDESSGIIVSRPKEVQELAEKIFKNMEENQ